MNPKLKPIPIPAAQRWLRFRQFGVPPLVFLLACVALASLWKDYVHPMDIQGEAHTSSAKIIAPESGYLSEVFVTSNQHVEAGSPIAMVLTTSPEILESSLAVLRAEVDLLLAGMDPLISKRRADFDYQRLQVELMSQRVDLATARVRHAQAEADLLRSEGLSRGSAVAIADYEQTKMELDSLEAEVNGRTELIETLDSELKKLSLNPPEGSLASELDPMQASLKVYEEKLRLTEAELTPKTLRAPIDGVVSRHIRKRGEFLTAGEPIATIVDSRPPHLVGYIPQPIRFTPEPGMQVEVLTRTHPKKQALAQITAVNPHFENLPETFAVPRSKRFLPVTINVPDELDLRPGELVDLRIRPES